MQKRLCEFLVIFPVESGFENVLWHKVVLEAAETDLRRSINSTDQD